MEIFITLSTLLAELLFYLTGGVAIFSSGVLFITFIIFLTVAITVSSMLITRYNLFGSMSVPLAVATGVLIVSFVSLVPQAQEQILLECKPISVSEFQTPGYQAIQFKIQECRRKANYYDAEYGNWRIVSVTRVFDNE